MSTAGPVKLPVSPKAYEVVKEIVALMETGFTGNYSIDLKDGIPMVRKRTDTLRFGKAQQGPNLTSGP